MYIVIAGAGKVGWNLARELKDNDHEVTVIESNRDRYMTVEEELEHNIHYGDASELWSTRSPASTTRATPTTSSCSASGPSSRQPI
jgi:nucleoside-diphosphate-sugar epimerase